MIVERRIAAADALQPVIEIEHDLVERQLIGDLRAAADISEVLLHPAAVLAQLQDRAEIVVGHVNHRLDPRSEEHTSELQSLMRISYAVFCLKKKNKLIRTQSIDRH